MKKIMFFAIAAFMIACAPSSTNTYTITGTVAKEGSEGKKIILTSTGSRKVLDSATIINGKFVIEGSVDAADIVALTLNGSEMELVLEPGNIDVNIKAKGEWTALGTPLNDFMTKFNSQIVEIYARFGTTMDSLKAIHKSDEVKIHAEFAKVYDGDLKPQLDKLSKDGLEKNKTNIVGVNIFTALIAKEKSVEQIKEFMAQNPFATTYAPLIDALILKVVQENSSAGKMFTDFDARNMADTKDVKLSDYVGKGKYVLADFWASWCSPCRAEIVHLAELHKKYAKDGLVILGVNVWDKHNAALASVKNMKMVWPQIYVPNARSEGGATDLYGIRGIPTVIIYAPDGTIIHRSHGGAEVIKDIEAIFKK